MEIESQPIPNSHFNNYLETVNKINSLSHDLFFNGSSLPTVDIIKYIIETIKDNKNQVGLFIKKNYFFPRSTIVLLEEHCFIIKSEKKNTSKNVLKGAYKCIKDDVFVLFYNNDYEIYKVNRFVSCSKLSFYNLKINSILYDTKIAQEYPFAIDLVEIILKEGYKKLLYNVDNNSKCLLLKKHFGFPIYEFVKVLKNNINLKIEVIKQILEAFSSAKQKYNDLKLDHILIRDKQTKVKIVIIDFVDKIFSFTNKNDKLNGNYEECNLNDVINSKLLHQQQLFSLVLVVFMIINNLMEGKAYNILERKFKFDTNKNIANIYELQNYDLYESLALAYEGLLTLKNFLLEVENKYNIKINYYDNDENIFFDNMLNTNYSDAITV